MGDTYNAQRTPPPGSIHEIYRGSKIEAIRRGWGWGEVACD